LEFGEECDLKVRLLKPNSQFSVKSCDAFLNCGGIKSQLVDIWNIPALFENQNSGMVGGTGQAQHC